MLSDPFTAFLSSAPCREPFDDLQRFCVHEGRPAGAGVDHSDGIARTRRHGVAGGSHARPGHRDQTGLWPALRQPLRLPSAHAGRGDDQDVFKRYLETLDGSKQFFTQTDITGFAPLEAGVGDALRGGKLDPAFQVFSVYKSASTSASSTRATCSSRTSISPAPTSSNTTARTCRGLPTTSSWTCCGASR